MNPDCSIRGCAILRGGPEFQLTYPCHAPNEQRWFSLKARPIEVNGRPAVLVIHDNVTDLKRAAACCMEVGGTVGSRARLTRPDPFAMPHKANAGRRHHPSAEAARDQLGDL